MPPNCRARRPDVLVVGAGNAALCAAISAHENGARVLMLEAAPFEERGGNSHFTGGAFRFAYRGVDDLIAVLPSLANEDLSNVDFGTYTEEQFFDDMFEVTEYRTDPDLCEILVRNSLDTATLGGAAGREAAARARAAGLQGRRQVQVLGRACAAHLGRRAGDCSRRSMPMWSGAASRSSTRRRRSSLIREHGRVDGRRRRASRRAGRDQGRRGRARLRQLRVQSGNARALSRAGLGARENPRHALQHGRRPQHGAGASARGRTATGRAAIRSPGTSTRRPMATSPSATSSRSTIIRSASSSTRKGERYVDEGANFHSHTYAKYGGEIMRQPGMFAWQVFDAKASHLLRGEYRIRRVTKAEADTLEELAPKLDGVDAAGVPAHRARLQRRLPQRRAVQSERARRPPHAGARDRQDQLGGAARYAAVPRLSRDDRRDLHLRRRQDLARRARSRISTAASFRGSMRRAKWSAGCSITTTQRHRPDVGRDLRPAGGKERGAIRAGAGLAECRAGRGHPKHPINLGRHSGAAARRNPESRTLGHGRLDSGFAQERAPE